MKFKRFAAAILACTFVGAAFVGCGSDNSSSEAPTTEAPTTEAPATTVAATPAATAAAPVEFEEAVTAESGDAILAMVDGQWYVQYWGKDTDLLTYDAGVAKITGDGDYTVSVNAGTKGCLYDITGDANGDYTPSGISFAAVKVFDGTTLFPDMSIEITSIKVDDKEIKMTAKNYTSSDDGIEMRANICNTYVNNLPEDAHTADGVVPADSKDYAPVIIDMDDFKSWTTIEVNFTVTGTGKTKEDAGAQGADESKADDASKAEDSAEADASSTAE